MRRVVVTGMGIVSPLGVGVEHNWQAITSGKSGIKKIEHFDVSDITSQIAGVIPRGDGAGEYNPDTVMEPKEQRKVDEFIVYGMAAAKEAIEDSGWDAKTEEQLNRTGVLIGAGIGGG